LERQEQLTWDTCDAIIKGHRTLQRNLQAIHGDRLSSIEGIMQGLERSMQDLQESVQRLENYVHQVLETKRNESDLLFKRITDFFMFGDGRRLLDGARGDGDARDVVHVKL
jgi:hypothetical protein